MSYTALFEFIIEDDVSNIIKYETKGTELSIGDLFDAWFLDFEYNNKTYYPVYAINCGEIYYRVRHEGRNGVFCKSMIISEKEEFERWYIFCTEDKSKSIGDQKVNIQDFIEEIFISDKSGEYTTKGSQDMISIDITTGSMSDSFASYGSTVSPSMSFTMFSCDFTDAIVSGAIKSDVIDASIVYVYYRFAGHVDAVPFGKFAIKEKPHITEETVSFNAVGIMEAYMDIAEIDIKSLNEYHFNELEEKYVWNNKNMNYHMDFIRYDSDLYFWEFLPQDFLRVTGSPLYIEDWSEVLSDITEYNLMHLMIPAVENVEKKEESWVVESIDYVSRITWRELLSGIAVLLRGNVIEKNGAFYIKKLPKTPVDIFYRQIFDYNFYDNSSSFGYDLSCPSNISVKANNWWFYEEKRNPVAFGYYNGEDTVVINDKKSEYSNASYYPVTIECPWILFETLDRKEEKAPFDMSSWLGFSKTGQEMKWTKLGEKRNTAFVYSQASVNMIGWHPAFSAGEIITVENYEGVKKYVYIGEMTVHYDGGISCEIKSTCDVSGGAISSGSGGTSSSYSTGSFAGVVGGNMSLQLGVTIKDGVISGSKITDSTIEGSKIKDSTLTGNLFEDGTITGSKIADSSITGSKFEDGTITGSKIDNSTITNSHIVDGTLDGNTKIANATISFEKVGTSFIDNLTADDAYVKNFKADVANIDFLTAEDAIIKNIQATAINTDYIKAQVAEVGYLTATEADIKYADIRFGNIDTANINVANIGLLFNEVGLIDRATIIDGHITGYLDAVQIRADSITAGVLDAGMVDVKNLRADSITVGQINGQQIAPGAIDMDNLSGAVSGEINSANSNAQTAVDKALEAFIKSEGASTIANNALNAFNNLEVGNRNILLKTNQGTSGWRFNFQNGSFKAEAVTALGVNACRFTIITASTGWAVIQYNDINRNIISTGKEYTVEFDILSNKSVRLKVEFMKANGTNSTGSFGEKAFAANVWGHYSGTVTFNSTIIGSQVIYITGLNATGLEFTIANIIMVEGNKCGSWTPAPEDLEKDIQYAQTSADGKSTVYYQTTPPSGSTYKEGDTWFDTDDSNRMYSWNGTSWVAKQFGTNAIANKSITNALIADATIQSAKIANLDAGKITSGYIDSARIKANSITANKMAVADFTNYVTVNPYIPDSMLPANFRFGGTKIGVTSDTNTLTVVKNSLSQQYLMFCDMEPLTFEDGDELYFYANIPNWDSSNHSATVNLHFYDVNKNHLRSFEFWRGTLITASWNKVSGSMKITNSILAGVRYYIIGIYSDSGSNIGFCDAYVKKKNSSNLIVDGAITANKINTGAVTADKIGAEAVTATKIAAGAVTSDKLLVGSGANLYATGYDTFENIRNEAARIYYGKSSQATVSIDKSTAYYGNKCLKIVSSGNAWLYLGDSSNGYGYIPVNPGKTYIISMWVKSASSSLARIWAVYNNDKTASKVNETEIIQQTIGTEWTRIWARVTPSTKYLAISVGNYTSGTTLWADAIQIETGTAKQEPSDFRAAGTTVIDGGNIVSGSITANSLDVTNIFGSNAILTEIFSKNITATGTITGATLKGTDAEIENGKIGGFDITREEIKKSTSLSLDKEVGTILSVHSVFGDDGANQQEGSCLYSYNNDLTTGGTIKTGQWVEIVAGKIVAGGYDTTGKYHDPRILISGNEGIVSNKINVDELNGKKINVGGEASIYGYGLTKLSNSISSNSTSLSATPYAVKQVADKFSFAKISKTGTGTVSTTAAFSNTKEILVQLGEFATGSYYTFTWNVNPDTIGIGNGIMLVSGYQWGSVYGFARVRLGRTTAEIVNCIVGGTEYASRSTLDISYR